MRVKMITTNFNKYGFDLQLRMSEIETNRKVALGKIGVVFITGAIQGDPNRYPNALRGATLVPSLFLAKDISGHSYDGTYSQGRITVRPSLRAEWAQGYYVDVAYARFAGGDFNILADRSNLTLVAGMRF